MAFLSCEDKNRLTKTINSYKRQEVLDMKNPYTIVFEINGYAIFALPLFDEFIEEKNYE